MRKTIFILLLLAILFVSIIIGIVFDVLGIVGAVFISLSVLLVISVKLFELIDERKHRAKQKQSCGNISRTGIIDVDFEKGPVMARIILTAVVPVMLAVAGIILVDDMYMAGTIDADTEFSLILPMIIIVGVSIGYSVAIEIPKAIFGFRRLRFDFTNGIFTQFDYPKMRTGSTFTHARGKHTQVNIGGIEDVEDLGDKIRVRLSGATHDTLASKSFSVKTKNLTWPHDEILKLFEKIVSENRNM